MRVPALVLLTAILIGVLSTAQHNRRYSYYNHISTRYWCRNSFKTYTAHHNA